MPRYTLFGLLLLFPIANAVGQIPFIQSPNSGAVRNNYSGYVGMYVTVGSAPITVTSLGRLDLAGNSQSHTVKVVTASTGVDVPGASVQVTMSSASAGSFVYGALPAPVQLAAGTAYFVLSTEVSGGDTWQDLGPVPTTADATLNGPGYQFNGIYVLNGSGSLAGESYGNVNFQYSLGLGTPFVTGQSGGTLRNNYSGFVGMKLTIGVQPLTINALGRIFVTGNSGTHTVKLVNATTGQDVAGGSVQLSMAGGTASTIKYAPLSTPLDLPANSSYYLVSQETSGGDQWYDYGPITVTTVASVPGAVYSTNSGYAIMPGTNLCYGPLGFLYTLSTPLITAQTPVTSRADFSGFVGMRFGLGSTPLTVTQLGRFCLSGNSQTHTVKLVQSNGSDLAGGSVSVSMAGCSPGHYAYGLFSSPITLGANTTWDIVSGETSGGDQWYNYAPVTATSAASILDAIYATPNSTDTTVPVAGYSYGPVNLQYESATAQPGNSTTGNAPTPPTVSISSPSANATVSGTVTITATASAAAGMSLQSVQFLENGTNIGSAVTGTGPGFSVQLNTSTLANGSYTLTAIASDSSGNSTTSSGISVTINNPVAVAPSGTLFITQQTFGPVRNNFTGYVGMQFTVGSSSLLVSQLGRMCIAGNSTSHTVKFITASGADFPGGSLALNMTGCAPGAYNYASLSTPVLLSAGVTYTLVSSEVAGGDQWYDYGPVTPASSSGTVNGPVYVTGSAGVLVQLPGNAYVPLNFAYSLQAVNYPPAGSPPDVSISGPASNSVLSGVVAVSGIATAAPGLTMQSVQFQRTSQNIGPPVVGYGPYYSTNLDTRLLTNGEYSLSAIATDSAGNYTFSDSEGVTILNNITPPSVSITGPGTGSTASGTITVAASATPASGTSLVSLQLQVDGQNFGSLCATSPCSASLDTTVFPNGKHLLSAVAFDSDEGHAVSGSVAITVSNAVTGIGALNGFIPGLARNYAGWIGMHLTTGCTALSVSAVGRIFVPGNTATHVVKFVRASDGSDVPGGSATISFTGAVANRITYAQLAAPITLAANTDYYLVSLETASGDQFYDYEPILALGAITVDGPAYLLSGTWQVPQNPNYIYVPVDFKFSVPGVPFPAAVTPTSATTQNGTQNAIAPANFNHILVTGQSLSVGATGGPPLTTTQPYSDLMLSSGNASLIPLEEGQGNMPTVDRNVESPDSAIGDTVTRLSGTGYTDIVTNAGVVGYSYAQLMKGTAPYSAAIAQFNASKSLSQAANKSYKISGVAVLHGETDDDLGTTAAAYESDLVQWQGNYQADGTAISGQSDSIPFFIDQENSWTYFNLATTTVALGQLSAAVDNPKTIYMVGPKYQYHYTDGVHLDSFGYRQQGEQIGKVMKQVLLSGSTWKPFAPTSVTRAGNIVTVKFNVPVPPLQFDTATVLPKAGMGFEYTDGSSCSPFVVSAQITAGDTVTLTLSATPFGTSEHVRYATIGIPGSSAGKDAQGAPRGNLKDSDGTTSAYGYDLSNWAVAFDRTVGTVAAANAQTSK